MRRPNLDRSAQLRRLERQLEPPRRVVRNVAEMLVARDLVDAGRADWEQFDFDPAFEAAMERAAAYADARDAMSPEHRELEMLRHWEAQRGTDRR